MEEKRTPWEDHLLERKTDRELKDIRRTAVAFANSVVPGHTAVILIGEGNDGSVSGVPNPDEQQKRVRTELEKIYPAIFWKQQLYTKEDKTCIRIEIEYSGDTPHFGDAAWVRKGSESIKASDEMLQKLVELRTSKVRELHKWLGKVVTVSWSVENLGRRGPNWNKRGCELVDVTGHFCIFRSSEIPGREESEPINWLELAWDEAASRPRIYVDPDRSLASW